jgi:multidrug efflux pump subunit AcrA (membrane-fusion protein)
VNNDKKKLTESMERAEELMELAERSGNTARYQQLEARLVSLEARLTALVEKDTLLQKEKTALATQKAALVEKDRLLAEANLLVQKKAAIGMFPTLVAVYCFLTFSIGVLGEPSPQQLALKEALTTRDFLAAGNVIVEVLGRDVKDPAARGTYNQTELKLFAQFELGPQTIDREGALAALQANMAFPFVGHGSYCATWASPGSGKTHVLAVAAERMSSGAWKGPEGSSLLPLLVTFNNKSSSIVFGVRGVAVRLLVTYFCGVVEEAVWVTVAQALDALLPEKFSIHEALWIVNVHVKHAAGDRAQPTLVVLLDELSKCLGDVLEPNRLSEIPGAVAAIRRALSSHLTTCKLVITTLDSVIGKDAASSGPSRVWIDLPALEYDSVLALTAIRQTISLDEAAKPLLSLVGGHPRSLAAVVGLLRGLSAKMDRHAVATLLRSSAIHELFAPIVVAPLLLGHSVGIATTNDLSAAVERGIASGALWGAIVTSDSAKPAVPFFSLLNWLSATEGDSVWSKTEDDGVWSLARRRCVSEFLEFAYKNIGDSGLGFESLHAHVMAARSVARAVLNEGKPYALFGESNNCVIRCELLCGSAVSVSNAERKNVFELEHKLDKHVGAWSMKNLAVTELDLDTVYAPGKGNAGFDLIELYEAPNGGKHLLLTECKYSDVDDDDKSTSKFGIAEARHKMKNVHSFLQHTLADPSSLIVKAGVTRADQVSLLFAPYRDCTSVVKGQIKEEVVGKGYQFGVALITKAELRKMYGPTLLPLFEFQSHAFDARFKEAPKENEH